MELNKVIKSETIELNLQGTTKEEILEELTDLLVKDGAISDKEGFLKDVYEREAVSSTGIGSHVAIPHGKSQSVVRTSIAMGRTTHDIEWESLDNKPVKFIILFAVTEEDKNTTHIKLLSKVAGTLADEDVCKELLTVKSTEDIIRIFTGEKELA